MDTVPELLRRLVASHQEWEACSARGLGALHGLRVALDRLTAEPQDLAQSKLVQRVAQQAPSAALDAFLSGRPPQPGVLAAVSRSLATLQQAQQACAAQTAAMDAVAQALQQAAVEACAVEAQDRPEGDAAEATPPVVDQALTAAVLAAGVTRQSAIQAKVVAALGLDTPASQLAAYATVWELQPHVDETTLALLEAWVQS